MQGVQAFEPKVKASIDLDSFVAEDHFLRRIDRVLDLSFVRDLTAACYADGKGRPSIDPEVYFRMQLVAYFNGITKDRRLCEEVHDNLAYRWFCRLGLDGELKRQGCAAVRYTRDSSPAALVMLSRGDVFSLKDCSIRRMACGNVKLVM